MIEHLEASYRIASGDIQDFDITTPEKILEKVHNTLYNYEKMPHNHSMPLMKKGETEDLRRPDLETAKQKMLEARERYLEFYKTYPDAKNKNAVFGELNRYEWYLLERKHLNHHFEQFGLI
jgi:oxepin-CoA hydrolase/3-oxo-5,6-dehydrosuberyl-CoA semialdehyde dehydrogenase